MAKKLDNITTFTCKKCKGKKRIQLTQISIECSECGGKGYLDWIENIVGVHKKIEEINPYECIMEEMARKMAEDIDREIFESLTKGDWDDNRGVSKLMFFDSVK